METTSLAVACAEALRVPGVGLFENAAQSFYFVPATDCVHKNRYDL